MASGEADEAAFNNDGEAEVGADEAEAEEAEAGEAEADEAEADGGEAGEAEAGGGEADEAEVDEAEAGEVVAPKAPPTKSELTRRSQGSRRSQDRKSTSVIIKPEPKPVVRQPSKKLSLVEPPRFQSHQEEDTRKREARWFATLSARVANADAEARDYQAKLKDAIDTIEQAKEALSQEAGQRQTLDEIRASLLAKAKDKAAAAAAVQRRVEESAAGLPHSRGRLRTSKAILGAYAEREALCTMLPVLDKSDLGGDGGARKMLDKLVLALAPQLDNLLATPAHGRTTSETAVIHVLQAALNRGCLPKTSELPPPADPPPSADPSPPSS